MPAGIIGLEQHICSRSFTAADAFFSLTCYPGLRVYAGRPLPGTPNGPQKQNVIPKKKYSRVLTPNKILAKFDEKKVRIRHTSPAGRPAIWSKMCNSSVIFLCSRVTQNFPIELITTNHDRDTTDT